jgi:hypothetical protein
MHGMHTDINKYIQNLAYSRLTTIPENLLQGFAKIYTYIHACMHKYIHSYSNVLTRGCCLNICAHVYT